MGGWANIGDGSGHTPPSPPRVEHEPPAKGEVDQLQEAINRVNEYARESTSPSSQDRQPVAPTVLSQVSSTMMPTISMRRYGPTTGQVDKALK